MAIDVFSITGKVAMDYANAINSIEEVSDAADKAAESLSGLDNAAGDTSESVDDVGKSTNQAGKSTEEANKQFSTWKITLANLAATTITALISKCTELAKSVVSLGVDFTSTMSEVQAISGATDEEMGVLEETARNFGSTTVFSAKEAADALKYMSLAGWTVEESTSALAGVLDLAAASGMDLASASDMVTDYLSAFSMEADKSAYFADILAYAQSHSNTTAEQLGEAYRNCAANLNAAGQDVETTTSLLEAMANQGYKGSEAGTALSAIMRDVTNAMENGAVEIGNTTISVMDANGNFRDLTGILTDVEAATNGMGAAERAAALSSTFTADSTKGLNLILNEGMQAVSGYEEELRTANGSASNMAATMNDNLSGDLANMNSAFEELKLKIYDGLDKPLRSATNFITDSVIPAVENLIQNFDKIAPIIAGVTAALIANKTALAISGAISAVTTAWTAYKTANEGVTISQWLLNAAMNANPIVLIITLVAGLVAAIITLWNTNEDFRNGVIAVWEGIKSAFKDAIDAISNFLNNIIEGFQSVWDSVVNIFSNVGTWVYDNIIAPIANYFKELWEGIVSAFHTVIDPWIEIVRRAATIVYDAVIKPIKDFFIDLWNDIVGVFSAASNWFNTHIAEPIQNIFVNIWNALKDGAKNAWEGIKSVFSGITDWFKNVFSKAWQAVKDVFSTGGKIFDGIKDGIVNAFKTVVNAIINGINKVIKIPFDAINKVLEKIHGVSILGVEPFSWVHTFNVPQIPELAKGGVLEKGQTGYLEGNGAEAVVPLEENTGWIRQVANQFYQIKAELEPSSESSQEIGIGAAAIRSEIANQTAELKSIMLLIVELLRKMDDRMADAFYDVMSHMRFQINEREFARLVKEV